MTGEIQNSPNCLIIGAPKSGTTTEQKVYSTSLSKLPDLINNQEIHAPTLMIVGEIVCLREKLGWFGD